MDNIEKTHKDFINKINNLNNDYNHEIKQRLLKEKNAYYVIEINYNSKKYIQAFKKDSLENVYYEIDDEIKEVLDKNLLEYFRDVYETKPSEGIY